jgi:two-component system chemotaxis response regulator CheY
MRVLVVDDDVVSRMVLMHLVDSCGPYEIFEAEDGEDAWRQLSEGLRPAICFCDLRMPRLSGLELLARMKATPQLAGVPFVLASSANDHATMAQANSLGASGYLVKPFERDNVLAELAGVAPHDTLDDDSAGATMARLGIDRERLLAYLGGFQTQLEAAAAEMSQLLGRADGSGQARERIEKLHAGCVTLGLDNAAARFAAMAEGRLESAGVHGAIAAALAAVGTRLQETRLLLPP